MIYLWLLERTDEISYDEYDSAIVAAENENLARYTLPQPLYGPDSGYYAWADPITLKMTFIGVADASIKPGVVLSSFNAG